LIKNSDTKAMEKSRHSPFHFIDRTLNVLIVDDDAASRDLIAIMLEPVSCYKVHTADSNGKALSALQSGVRFHVCIVDLGLPDVENDEFYLIRNYACHSSIIVLTGSPSPRKGALCIQLGARAVFDKGIAFVSLLFFRTLNRLALINLVNCRYTEWSVDTLNLATRLLFDKSPASVTQWAEYLSISDRQLRNLWHTGSGFGAKQVLFLHNCFSGAFAYYESILFKTEERQRTTKGAAPAGMASYFRKHSDLLNFLIS